MQAKKAKVSEQDGIDHLPSKETDEIAGIENEDKLMV